MNQIFSIDNRFIQLLNKIFCAAWLNILWFLCCIPIFTIGASTTALYYVSFKLVRNEEGNITKQFFTAFRSNFKKATLIWLPLLGLGILFGIDGYVLYHISSGKCILDFMRCSAHLCRSCIPHRFTECFSIICTI